MEEIFNIDKAVVKATHLGVGDLEQQDHSHSLNIQFESCWDLTTLWIGRALHLQSTYRWYLEKKTPFLQQFGPLVGSTGQQKSIMIKVPNTANNQFE